MPLSVVSQVIHRPIIDVCGGLEEEGKGEHLGGKLRPWSVFCCTIDALRRISLEAKMIRTVTLRNGDDRRDDE